MSVPASFLQVHVRLIADENLMTSIAETDGRGIYLITVAQPHSVEIATYQDSYRVGGTVGETGIHTLGLVLVHQSA